MFKKTLRVATVLTLVFGCYMGYVRGFALVVKSLEANQKGSSVAFVKRKSKSKLESIARAKKSFGDDHWTSEDRADCYIGRDFMLYFKSHKQPGEKYDGKRMILNPIAVIMQADGGKSSITVTAEEGVFDCNQRPGLGGKDPLKVLHASLRQNVILRHDRGTPDDPDDDLFVGPLTYAEFDDAKLQIESESDILIRDRDTTITGEQFLIQLRPKVEIKPDAAPEPRRGGGFDGVQTAILRKNVHVSFRDVGRTGFLPGSGTEKKTKPTATPPTTSGTGPVAGVPPAKPKPLDLRSSGHMTVTFPEPRPQARVGPPAPARPTLIDFNRDVLTQIGKLDEKPDQLSCDTLELVLYPAEAPPPTRTKKSESASNGMKPSADPEAPSASESSEAPPAGGGSFGNLALRSLKATGHSVWLRLSQQTTTIHGIELKHHKRGPSLPDVTNMLGKPGRGGLTIEKLDLAPGDSSQKIVGVTNVWGSNLTVYDDGGDTNNATIIIQGPGRLETRADRDQPAQRIAEWQDALDVQNAAGSDPVNPIKIITFVGVPFVRDLTKPDAPSSLDASQRIIAWLKPKPPEAAAARPTPTAGSPLTPGSSGYNLHQLRAFEDAHLISPGQNITARKKLNAEFLAPPVAAGPAPAALASNAGPIPADPPKAKSEPPKPKAPPERKVDADTVWANVQLLPPSAAAGSRSGGGTPSPEYEVREVQLIRNVVFHQDPEEGKALGNDATGEALYLFNEGENKIKMVLFNDVPKQTASKDGVPGIAWTTPDDLRQSLPPATISTDEMQLTGAIIGLDQTQDFAYVNGPGSLKQLVDRGMMADSNPVGAPTDPAQPGDAAAKADSKSKSLKIQTRAGVPLSEKTELTINWTENMRFHGRSPDFEGRPNSAARAEFYGHVTAITQEKDSMLDCTEKMITYTDRPVPFTKLSQARPARNATKPGINEPTAAEATNEPKAELALIEMFGDAVAVNRKIDPNQPIVLQKQRIQTEHLIYDRRTGDFTAPGEGFVFLYDRKGSEPDTMRDGSNNRQAAGDRAFTPTSMQLDQDGGMGYTSPEDLQEPAESETEDVAAVPVQRRDTIARSNTPRSRGNAKSKARPNKPGAADQPGVKTIPPLILTQIQFARSMHGRFGTSNKSGESGTRTAEFFGDVEVIRSPVSQENVILDRKDWSYRPPREVYFLTAQTLRVMTEPPLAGSPPNAPARHWMKAWENASLSTTDKILQGDVITYTSSNDLFYAYGEDGHQVTIAQQTGTGQPGSPTRQQALSYHPKSGGMNLVNPQYISLIDGKTGTRPWVEHAPDPEAKPKKKTKRAIKPRTAPMERRGFSGR